jgi:hypothetical protein
MEVLFAKKDKRVRHIENAIQNNLIKNPWWRLMSWLYTGHCNTVIVKFNSYNGP